MTKKVALVAVIVLTITSLNLAGQGGAGGSGVTVEYTANPFSSTSFLSPGYIRAKFLAGPLGFRLGAKVDMANTQLEPTTIQHVGFFDLRPGFEFHTGTGKASPYAGIELIFMNQSANLNSTSQIGIANAITPTGRNQAFFGYGTALVSGVDYYWGEKFYFGFEVGLDFVWKNYKDVLMAGEVMVPATSDFGMMTNLNNTIKMGFNF